MHKNSLRYADYVVAPGCDMYEALVKKDFELAARLHAECAERDKKTLERARKLSAKTLDTGSS